ncbi:MAG: hypothetical protein P4M10_04665 [Verrucomicrobiae bacterium]|nr:hypothetical protein [Verrucomicrobiae bacterium]
MLDFNRKSRLGFSRTISEALALIEQIDTRRFKRVKREIHLIVYDRSLIEPLPIALYFHQAKASLINLGRFDLGKGPKFEMAILASLIVHHATYGHLHRKGVVSGIRIRKDRADSVCVKEEIRFLLKAGVDLRGSDTHVDVDWWSQRGQS